MSGEKMAGMIDTNPSKEANNSASLAASLVARACQYKVSLASAESLTGGMVGEQICSVSGASAVYLGGVISYASSVKEAVLGVSGALLAERGSVDADVALAMAEGARRVCGADFGISTTGVAGPEPHDGKSVGTVFIGLTGPQGSQVLQKNYAGQRQEIREQATFDALQLLYQQIAGL